FAMLDSYHDSKRESFNAAVAEYPPYLKTILPSVVRKAEFEVQFNRFEPFIASMYLYVTVFLLVLTSWLAGWKLLARTAFWVLCLTLGFHTLGLIARIYIQGRPPVTNLYSSAIFIAWAGVVFCVAIEGLYRNGVGSLCAAVIAFPSLIIAHYLAGSGDTMQMLQAVLDTNIWLATHVVVVTLGYTATFLAGVIAAVYILGASFTTKVADVNVRRT